MTHACVSCAPIHDKIIDIAPRDRVDAPPHTVDRGRTAVGETLSGFRPLRFDRFGALPRDSRRSRSASSMTISMSMSDAGSPVSMPRSRARPDHVPPPLRQSSPRVTAISTDSSSPAAEGTCPGTSTGPRVLFTTSPSPRRHHVQRHRARSGSSFSADLHAASRKRSLFLSSASAE